MNVSNKTNNVNSAPKIKNINLYKIYPTFFLPSTILYLKTNIFIAYYR